MQFVACIIACTFCRDGIMGMDTAWLAGFLGSWAGSLALLGGQISQVKNFSMVKYWQKECWSCLVCVPSS